MNIPVLTPLLLYSESKVGAKSDVSVLTPSKAGKANQFLSFMT